MRCEKPRPVFVWGDSRRLLKDIEERYVDAFTDLGPGAVQDFKHLLNRVDDFFDLLLDEDVKPVVKMLDYGKLREEVSEFCRYYAKWLGGPLMERLKTKVYEVLEQALDWWGNSKSTTTAGGGRENEKA